MRYYTGEEREKKVYEGVPRPAYRGIKDASPNNGQPASFRVGFLIEGLELKSIRGFDSSKAYYNPQNRTYSGVALVRLESGVKLEVSVNGLGENKARQKVFRAITQYEDNHAIFNGRYNMVGTKRAHHKATARAKAKTKAKTESWRPPAPSSFWRY